MTSFISAVALLIAACGFLLLGIFANRIAKALSRYLTSRALATADTQSAKELLRDTVDKLINGPSKG